MDGKWPGKTKNNTTTILLETTIMLGHLAKFLLCTNIMLYCCFCFMIASYSRTIDEAYSELNMEQRLIIFTMHEELSLRDSRSEMAEALQVSSGN